MNTLDLHHKYKSYYTASEQPELVDIPDATYGVNYIIDGGANPSL